MSKKIVNSQQHVKSAFKLAVLLVVVLGSFWFIYNYLQTGSFDFMSDAKCPEGACLKNGGGAECASDATCRLKYGKVSKNNPNYGKTKCNKSTGKCIRQSDPKLDCSLKNCKVMNVTYLRSRNRGECKPDTGYLCDVTVESNVCDAPPGNSEGERICGYCNWQGSHEGIDEIPSDKCIVKEIRTVNYSNCVYSTSACPI